MENWLIALERILLSFIVGGGVIVAACVRPFLLQALQTTNQEILETVERISIRSWNRYNRLALFMTGGLVLLEVVRFLTNTMISVVHPVLLLLMLAALFRKLTIDQRLLHRLGDRSTPAATDARQQASHRSVELLSKGILLLASILLMWVSFV